MGHAGGKLVQSMVDSFLKRRVCSCRSQLPHDFSLQISGESALFYKFELQELVFVSSLLVIDPKTIGSLQTACQTVAWTFVRALSSCVMTDDALIIRKYKPLLVCRTLLSSGFKASKG